jgi:hypothetical protein
MRMSEQRVKEREKEKYERESESASRTGGQWAWEKGRGVSSYLLAFVTIQTLSEKFSRSLLIQQRHYLGTERRMLLYELPFLIGSCL